MTMIEIEPTNIKPEAWYNKYYDWVIELNDYDWFNEYKKEDRLMDIFHVIHNHLIPFKEQMDEAWSIMEPFFKNKLTNSNEYKEAKERYDKAKDIYYSDIPFGVNEEEFDSYYYMLRGKRGDYGDREIILEYNTLEKNGKFLEFLIAQCNYLKNKRNYKQPYNPDCRIYSKVLEKRFKLCKQALKDGFLITGQLVSLNSYSNDFYCTLSSYEKKRYFQTLFDVLFKGFTYTDDQIFDLIRKNENWRNIERDIAIFREKQKGKYLQELADKHGVDYTNISKIVKKVRSAVNYYKGKLFEDFIKKKLKQSGLFEKAIKEAGKGEADILAYFKDGKRLNIYSLKNIKIDRKPYWLVIEELRPELTRAKLQAHDYKVQLILLVFDSHTKQIKQFKIDYKNTVNIDISK
jgi:hypothetical protein